MRLSRMIDHIKPLFRPKSDQQFSHSLCHKWKLLVSAYVDKRGAGQYVKTFFVLLWPDQKSIGPNMLAISEDNFFEILQVLL